MVPVIYVAGFVRLLHPYKIVWLKRQVITLPNRPLSISSNWNCIDPECQTANFQYIRRFLIEKENKMLCENNTQQPKEDIGDGCIVASWETMYSRIAFAPYALSPRILLPTIWIWPSRGPHAQNHGRCRNWAWKPVDCLSHPLKYESSYSGPLWTCQPLYSRFFSPPLALWCILQDVESIEMFSKSAFMDKALKIASKIPMSFHFRKRL